MAGTGKTGIDRRCAVLGGLALPAGLAAIAGAMPASARLAQGETADQTHVLRHYVFAAQTMDQMQNVRAELKANAGIATSEPRHLKELGFSTVMAMVGGTTLELVAPDVRGRRPKVDHFLDVRGAPGIYKLVFQTFDAAALRRRIYASKLPLERDEQFRGQEMIAIEPEMFGVSLETYQYTPLDDWWGNASSKALPPSDVVESIPGCDVAMRNPRLTATFVSHLFQADLDSEAMAVRFQPNRTVPFHACEMRYQEPGDSAIGVNRVDLKARDRKRAGETFRIYSTEFRFV